MITTLSEYINNINEDNSNNNTIISGTIIKYIYPLIYDFVDFCKESLGIDDNTKIKINFKQIKNNEIGFVNFSKIVNGNFEIVVDKNAGYDILLKYISHEMTHIKQIKNKELQFKDGFFIWKNIKTISLQDYNNIVVDYDFIKYKNLAWEIESYSNQDEILKKYISSDSYKNIYNNTVEPNLKFILQNTFNL